MGKNALNNRVNAIREAKPLEWELPPSDFNAKLADARELERKTSYKYAVLKLKYDMQLECAVLNYHNRGIKIALKSQITLPEKVTVIVPEMGLCREAKIVWRSGEQAGLEFISSDS